MNNIQTEAYGEKHFIRHIKTPDKSVKNDCLIRALVEATNLTYYQVCQKLHVPYIVKGMQRSVPKDFEGVTIGSFQRYFNDRIENFIYFEKNIYDWIIILQNLTEQRYPSILQFTKTYSRRKALKDKKLILFCANTDNKWHSVYCKNGYFYETDNVLSKTMFVICFAIMK